MRKLNNILDHIEEIFGVIVFSVMCLVVLWAVICRFILHLPFPYGEELARYLMIYGIFIGVSIGVRRSSHLGVEVLNNFLPKGLLHVVDIISQILSVVLYVAFFWFSLLLTQNIMKNGQTSAAMHIPMWIAYAALPIGFALSIIRSAQMTLKVIRNEKIEVQEVDV